MGENRAHFLLVGDSEDIPTIRATLRRLPVDAYGQVFIEVPSTFQVQRFEVPAGVAVTWLCRDEFSHATDPVPPRGELIARATRAWVAEWMPEEHAPDVPFVLWIGCSTSERVDEIYWELRDGIPHLHLHHPHHDD